MNKDHDRERPCGASRSENIQVETVFASNEEVLSIVLLPLRALCREVRGIANSCPIGWLRRRHPAQVADRGGCKRQALERFCATVRYAAYVTALRAYDRLAGACAESKQAQNQDLNEFYKLHGTLKWISIRLAKCGKPI